MSITIREATCTDALAIAHVHVASWQTTYRGLLSQEFLEGLSVSSREKYWQDVLCAEHRNDCMLVAVDNDEVVGFASAGTERTGSYNARGELYAIYLLASHQREGIGRKLVKSVAQWLLQAGIDDMLVWVLRDNPSWHFYEKLGGKAVGAQLVMIGGVTFEETGYHWSDITVLVKEMGQSH
jgi:GNAT superfamily N-acetyltransferase